MGFFTKKKAMDRDSIDTMLMRHDVKGLINALKHEDKRIVGWAAMALADAYHVWEWVKADEVAGPIQKAYEDYARKGALENWDVLGSLSAALTRIKGEN